MTHRSLLASGLFVLALALPAAASGAIALVPYSTDYVFYRAEQ